MPQHEARTTSTKVDQTFRANVRTTPSQASTSAGVNHMIPLIDPNARYATQTPCCSNALFPQPREKME
jgi:hypothetical protein